jgi:hypothetical protein
VHDKDQAHIKAMDKNLITDDELFKNSMLGSSEEAFTLFLFFIIIRVNAL